MPASATLVCEDAPETAISVADWPPVVALGVEPAPPARRPRRAAAAAMLAGVVAIVGAAGLTLAPRGGPSSSEPVPAPVPAANAHALGPLAVTLSGPGDVTVLTQAYEPGGDSGWHAHPGIHAVAVLSGTLTVYDENCRPQTFGPGQPYIGGQEPHRVRNEAQEPVQMIVTYLNPAGPHNSNRSVPAPAACGTAG